MHGCSQSFGIGAAASGFIRCEAERMKWRCRPQHQEKESRTDVLDSSFQYANYSVRDSVGHSICVDQPQARRCQSDRRSHEIVFLNKLDAEILAVEPPCIVVIGLSADATRKMMQTPLSGLAGTEVTQSRMERSCVTASFLLGASSPN